MRRPAARRGAALVACRATPATPLAPSDWRSHLQAQLPAIVAAWSAGALLLALRLLLGCGWVGRLRAGARLPDARWQGRFDELAVRVGLRAPVPLRISDAHRHAGRRRLVAADGAGAGGAARGMPAELLEALLAHELAHVRRRDYLVNLLQGAVETLLFYHPVRVVAVAAACASSASRSPTTSLRARSATAPAGARAAGARRFQQTTHSGPARLPRAPGLAIAAHGGQLMSRISASCAPTTNVPTGKLALPLAGLAALGLAVHAAPSCSGPAPPSRQCPRRRRPLAARRRPRHAAVAPMPALAAMAPAARLRARAHGRHRGAPWPRHARDRRRRRLVAAAPTGRAGAGHERHARGATSVSLNGGNRLPYALVRASEDGMMLSGDWAKRRRQARSAQHVHGDFLWFRGRHRLRRAGPATSPPRGARGRRPRNWARAWRRWAKQMRRMASAWRRWASRWKALGSQANPMPSEMEALGKRMEPLARQQAELGEKMAALAAAAPREADDARIEAAMAQLQSRMEALQRRMETRRAPCRNKARRSSGASPDAGPQPQDGGRQRADAATERAHGGAGQAAATAGCTAPTPSRAPDRAGRCAKARRCRCASSRASLQPRS
jgi:hypothetical protein